MVLRGPATGMRFVAQSGMGLSYAIGNRDAAPRYFAGIIRDGDVVYDVGANKGQMTLIFSRLVGRGSVLSFEPSLAERKYLTENLRLNRISNVRVVEAAASDSAGTATFLYSDAHPTMGKLAAVEADYVVDGSRAFNVSTVTLDSMTEASGMPAFIKLDVEGGAAAVLRGARQIIEQLKTVFYIELHGREEQVGVQKELLDRGYSAYAMNGQVISDLFSAWIPQLLCKP